MPTRFAKINEPMKLSIGKTISQKASNGVESSTSGRFPLNFLIKFLLKFSISKIINKIPEIIS